MDEFLEMEAEMASASELLLKEARENQTRKVLELIKKEMDKGKTIDEAMEEVKKVYLQEDA